jgi:hypothetical protein
MNGRWSFATAARLVLAAWALQACNSEPTKLDQMAEAAASPPPPASSVPRESVPSAPPAPMPPAIVVDDGACTIDGEEVLFLNPDARDRIAATLAGKPLVAGQVVALDARREAKTPRVAAVVSALRKAKATGASIHTLMRDNSTGELLVRFTHGPASDCAPVAMITRDGSIAVWGASGGVAQKFARGFAGPDLTLATEGLRRASAACGSSVWVLAADDNIAWGLTFDLAMRARGAQDGGSPLRATETALASEAPVPGRKVVLP